MSGRSTLRYGGMLLCMAIPPGCAGSRRGGDGTQPGRQNPPLVLSIFDYPKEAEAGQAMELAASVTNTTQSQLTICKWKGFLFTMRMEMSGQKRFLVENRHRSPRSYPGGHHLDYLVSDFLSLAPGEAYVLRKTDRAPDWFAGTMHLTCVFESSWDGSAVGKKAWVGSVSSSVVDIDILPADKTDPTETD